MRVCLDGRGLGLPDGTGVATYAAVLARCLPLAGCERQLLVDGDWDAAARHLVPRPGGGLARAGRWARALDPRARPAVLLPEAAVAQAAALRRVPDAFRTAQVHFDAWRRFLPLAIPGGDPAPPALMHWTYPLPLRLRGVPNLYTVHDLIPLLHPALTPIDPRRMRRMLDGVGAAARHVVTVSEASRREIVETLGWPPGRVTNAYQAVDLPADAASLGPAGFAETAALAAAPDGYFVHAGTIEPRKNLARLIEAYRASGTRALLVLAGPDGWRAADQLAPGRGLLCRADGAGPGIVRLPWLERRALLGLIRGAKALLMPSLAEGFGLPVAEAMALGTPVMTSGEGALAEVAGGAALLVDPRDGAAMAAALRALGRDAGLRAGLAAGGSRRAALFTMDAYADRLRDLYSRIAGPAA